MQNSALATLVEQITHQLHTLSEAELRTVQDVVGYLVWKRDHSQPSCASLSAETLALERLPDLHNPVQWVTVIDAGETVNESDLEDWLNARG